MLPNLRHAEDPDETPTRVSDNFPTATLVLASRVDRLAELAIEKLMVADDDDALASAVENLSAIRALAGTVLR